MLSSSTVVRVAIAVVDMGSTIHYIILLVAVAVGQTQVDFHDNKRFVEREKEKSIRCGAAAIANEFGDNFTTHRRMTTVKSERKYTEPFLIGFLVQ